MIVRKAVVASVLMLLAAQGRAQSDLESGFKNPPAQAKPHTWWHWMNGNITKQGITADLEAMKKIGLGGAQIFNVSESIPDGPVKIMSPEWVDLIKFAASEADRLGIELCMHNCSGWSSSGGPWIKPEQAMQMVVFSEAVVNGPRKLEQVLVKPKTKVDFYRDIVVLAFPTSVNGVRINDIGVKAGFDYRYNQQPVITATPGGSAISLDSIVELTGKMDEGGKLTWDVPEGNWTIMRIGYTPTGAQNAPSPASGRGLECDKLSKDGLDAHWAGMMGPVIEALGPLAGKTLNNCLIDSYEMGGQNWTPRFSEEFKKRRGYDLTKYLPVIAGWYVGSGQESERFLWDFRRTIADLFADNYYSYFAELCHKSGMKASIEPYDGPFECLLTGRDADIPMGEFWVGASESNSCKLAASVAHTYGRQIVGAESFTAVPQTGKWLNHPYSLKSVGDLMYTVGINRYIIHRYAHQPWLDKFPGMTMGQWGTHFERTTTWWNQGSAWVQYLARCQYLLQQGKFVADLCYFPGDAAPNDVPFNMDLKAKGYDYDAVNADVLFSRMSVKDGRLTLKDGMSYRAMVLPEVGFITPRSLARVAELVKQGATVIGPRPSRSPSLTDFPKADAEVAKIAGEMWGNADGKAVRSHSLGKGKVIWGDAPEKVLADAGVGPDCEFAGAVAKMSWIHRVADGVDIYFLSNQGKKSQEVECMFRVSGKAPELWHADTGEMERAPVWSEKGGRTTVPIRFDPAGSVFVVFRKAAVGEHLVSVKLPVGREPVKAPTVEIKKAVYEAVDGAGSVDVTAKVAAMAKAGQMTIPADNSSYGDPTYNHVKRLRVEYLLDGKPMSKSVEENGTVELVQIGGPDVPPVYVLHAGRDGNELVAFQKGEYQFETSGGKSTTVNVKELPPVVEVTGPWSVHFPPNWGAPASATLDKLMSWTESADAGVKYFSGTAEYEKEFEVSPGLVMKDRALFLDLGNVQNIAEVSLNGKDLGIWWKPPFSADISGVVKAGKNTLKVKVTNLWVNRLIGDEQLPEDVEWNGIVLKQWPKWMVEGTPRPSKRLTFTTWHHWRKVSALVDSGLLGPVLLRPGARVAVEGGSGR